MQWGESPMMVPRVALALLGIAFAIVFFVSDREWSLTSMPSVERIDTLPDRPELAPVRHYTEIGSGLLPYSSRARARHAAQPVDSTPEIHVGYAYRELSILRLPLWASEEAGLVTYFETPQGYQVALMGEEQVRLLERLTGRRYSDYSFPVWKHMWGWLFALGLIVWHLLHRRAEAKWREETGII